MPTIHDVARQAGASIATVSRTMPDDGALAAPPTRARVLRAVAELGYAPHAAGTQLRTTRSHRLLVTVPDIASPFFSPIIQYLERAARQCGYALVLGDARDAGGRARYHDMLTRR